jgi:oxygen-independent coproporphyrinogen-3 oxidase
MSYVEAAAREIAVTAARVGRVSVPSIYFGGGTPSLLPAELIGGLLTAVRTFFDVDDDAEVTLEANPQPQRGASRDAGNRLPEAYFAHLQALGLNRISLGVQSSHEDELHLLRRGHSFADAIATYETVRRAGFANVNIDRSGLPISRSKWRATLERVTALQPSIFPRTVCGSAAHHAALGAKWARARAERMSSPRCWLAHEMLAQTGFEHYEISNWAKKKSEARSQNLNSRHNLVYWRNEPYFGLGCGAHSSFGGRRYSNVRHPREYVERIRRSGEAVAEVEEIDRPLEMGETLMLGLRLIEEGVARARFKDRFGVELDEIYGATIARLVEQGLLEADSERIRLTAQGRLLGNRVFGEFLP